MKIRWIRIVTSFLVFVLVLSLAPTAVASTSGDYEYKDLSDGTISITKYKGNASSVEIPEKIDGKTVSVIGDRAFRYASIESIIVPGTVISIESHAFFSCDNLSSVVIKQSDHELKIGDYAFDGDTDLESVEIGAKRITFDERAFRYCSGLRSVNFTNEKTEEIIVGEKAFFQCTGLLTFQIPDSVITLKIGPYAFDGDTALQKVHLSGEKITVEERAFRYCSILKEVTVSKSSKTVIIGEKAFFQCEELLTFSVPEEVKDLTIGVYAFDGATNLKSVSLGSSNVEIGERAFRYCSALAKILIPDGKVSFGEKAFFGCSNLTIYGKPGSVAEKYAKDNKISFANASTYIPEKVEEVTVIVPPAEETNNDNTETPDPSEAPESPSVPDTSQDWICPNCGETASGNFCSNCGSSRPDGDDESSETAVEPTPKPTPEPVDSNDSKHLQYIRNYVGLNALSVGYTSLGGDRRDKYGACTVVISFITVDGSFIDISDDSDLQQYTVIGQNPAPNSELRIGYERDSQGKEYSNLTAFQSYEVIDLYVTRDKTTSMKDFPEHEELLPAPDKYTRYVYNYVGKNLASFGYTSLGGDRRDHYGDGTVEFVFITNDGAFIDIENEDQLKQYVVVAQNYPPNTEMKMTYQTDSKGEEYSNLIDYQSIEQIDLFVVKKEDLPFAPPEMTLINPAEDKYTFYIRDYTGKNVANIGYTSLGGTRNDQYGDGYIRFMFVTDDGTTLDPKDEEQLKQYVVVSQDVSPNSLLKLTYMKDSKGEEYSNLVESQTYDRITLHVRRIG